MMKMRSQVIIKIKSCVRKVRRTRKIIKGSLTVLVRLIELLEEKKENNEYRKKYYQSTSISSTSRII